MAGIDAAPKRPRRGRPPAIRLDDVIEATAGLALDEITIQGVADQLGVTRAAIYHYVENVDQLRRLAAREAMVELAYDDSAATSWEEWLHGWADAMRRWRLANGSAGPGLFLTAEVLVSDSVLVAIEHGVDLLVDAGFPRDDAARAMQFLVSMVWINTQDEIMARSSEDGVHPQAAVLRELDLPAPDAFERVNPFSDPDRRFDHDVRLAVDALSTRLERLLAHDDAKEPKR